LLASLEERSTHRVLGCFLGAGDGDDLEEEFLADEATRDEFALFWGAVAELEMEAFPCFRKVRLKGFFLCLSYIVAFVVLFPVVMIDGHY